MTKRCLGRWLFGSILLLGGCTSTTTEATSSTITTPTTSSTSPTSTNPQQTPPNGLDSITTADGMVRTFRIVDLSEDASAPLILVLHGFGGTADGMRAYAGIERSVEETLDEGAIVVYPNGSGADEGFPQSWNAGGCCPFSTFDMVDDVAFLADVIESVSGRFDVDPDRVWVVGHSNGGMMAYRLACELSTRVTAIGVAAGAMMIDTCASTRPTSALHLHGELDVVVPLLGGDGAGITFPSAQQSIERFSSGNQNRAQLVTDADWTHDWQPEWATLFLEFLAAS